MDATSRPNALSVPHLPLESSPPTLSEGIPTSIVAENSSPTQLSTNDPSQPLPDVSPPASSQGRPSTFSTYTANQNIDDRYEQHIADLEEHVHYLQNVNELTPTRPPAMPELARPSTFTGKPNESVDTWLFTMEQYLQLVHVPSNNKVIFT